MGEGDRWDSTEGMAMVFWRERGADSFLGEFEKIFSRGIQASVPNDIMSYNDYQTMS